MQLIGKCPPHNGSHAQAHDQDRLFALVLQLGSPVHGCRRRPRHQHTHQDQEQGCADIKPNQNRPRPLHERQQGDENHQDQQSRGDKAWAANNSGKVVNGKWHDSIMVPLADMP